MYIEFDKEYLRELFENGHINDRKHQALHGDKEGVSSVRVNRKYRLEFTVSEEMGEQIITVCRLLDISNHYK